MCYSAMVIQDAKKLGLRFHARVQTELYLELFMRRLSGERLTINRAMEAQFPKTSRDPEIKKITKAITDWRANQVATLEAEIFKQKERLANAERSLKVKTTKKAEEDVRIATKKIEKCKADLKKHASTAGGQDSDHRIYPFHYVSMVYTNDEGERAVRPFRYHMRPHNEDESFDREYGGCYNARANNLKRVAFWKDCLAKRRGLLLVQKFYENVPVEKYLENNKLPKASREKSNLVLCFEPDQEVMLIPTLWDVWKKRGQSPLYSAALITDDPAPEIQAAGHDRTPIQLSAAGAEAWLSAPSVEEALAALRERETCKFAHRILGAA